MMLMNMDYRTTLDIDTNDKEFTERMLAKIATCKHLIYLKIKESPCKGYHITILCDKECDMCRLCFDDERRFYFDSFRPEWAKNILFDKKEIIEI